MVFKLFQLHKSNSIPFYCYSIYKTSSFKNMRVDLSNKQYHCFIKHHTNKRNPDFVPFKKKTNIEGLQKITVGIMFPDNDNDATLYLVSQIGLSCFLCKRLLLYLSSINCMNIKGWLSVWIAGAVLELWLRPENKQKYPLFPKDFSIPLLYLFQHHIVLKCLHIKGHSFPLSKHFFVVYIPRGMHRINSR